MLAPEKYKPKIILMPEGILMELASNLLLSEEIKQTMEFLPRNLSRARC